MRRAAFQGTKKVEGGRTTHAGEAGASVRGINCCPIIGAVFPQQHHAGGVCVRVHVCRARPDSHCPAQPGDAAPGTLTKTLIFLLPFQSKIR